MSLSFERNLFKAMNVQLVGDIEAELMSELVSNISYTCSTVFVLGKCILGNFERITTYNELNLSAVLFFSYIITDYGKLSMKNVSNTYSGNVAS